MLTATDLSVDGGKDTRNVYVRPLFVDVSLGFRRDSR